MLYKHKKVAGTTLQYDVKKQASVEAARLGFVAVTNALIKRPYYVDSTGVDTAYEYAVSSKDVSGAESGLSALAESSATATALNAPFKLLIHHLDGKAELAWFKADAKSIISYNVYRKTVGEKGFKKIATVGAQQTTYSDKDLQGGKLYIYRVKSASEKEESVGYAENSYKAN
jgi:fibronectin type 3 domain-containing protein